MKIQIVDAGTITEVIETRQPLGLFLCRDGRRWVVVDNSTGDAWTEDFRWKFRAVQWLKGKFELDSRGRNRLMLEIAAPSPSSTNDRY